MNDRVTGLYLTPASSIGPASDDAVPTTDQRSVGRPLAGGVI